MANPPRIHVQADRVRPGSHHAQADDEEHDQLVLLLHLVGVAEELRLQSGEGRAYWIQGSRPLHGWGRDT